MPAVSWCPLFWCPFFPSFYPGVLFFSGALSFLVPFLSWCSFFPGALSFPFLALASFWRSLFADRHVIFVDTTGSKSYWILLFKHVELIQIFCCHCLSLSNMGRNRGNRRLSQPSKPSVSQALMSKLPTEMVIEIAKHVSHHPEP